MSITTFFLFLFCTSSTLVNATELKVGDKAPHFKLQATNGKTYDLNDYLGKQTVVLAWYPKANTYGCTLECRSLVKKGHLIREFNAVYMMASVDPLKKNIKFAKEQKVDFPMLSDPTKKVAEAYDVLNFLNVASRVTFYIGKDGTILKIDDDVNAEKAAQDIARILEQLKIEPQQGF
ncbi:MAG: peroxiredoxin [Parashewanella sp.]